MAKDDEVGFSPGDEDNDEMDRRIKALEAELAGMKADDDEELGEGLAGRSQSQQISTDDYMLDILNNPVLAASKTKSSSPVLYNDLM